MGVELENLLEKASSLGIKVDSEINAYSKKVDLEKLKGRHVKTQKKEIRIVNGKEAYRLPIYVEKERVEAILEAVYGEEKFKEIQKNAMVGEKRNEVTGGDLLDLEEVIASDVFLLDKEECPFTLLKNFAKT